MAQQLLSDRIETTIISNLFFNEDFTRKALPFIQPEYFSNADERILFSEIFKFVDGYKNLPTKDTILIELNNRKDLNEDQLKNLRQLVSNASEEETDLQWLLDTNSTRFTMVCSQQFCPLCQKAMPMLGISALC